MDQVIIGKKQICSFVHRSWKTIEEWILTRGFPAKKINGVWESDSELITLWRRRLITGESKRSTGRSKTRGAAGR